MNVRFQADADINHIIVAGVLRRFPEIDFRTATQAGRHGSRIHRSWRCRREMVVFS
jgi:hypothetical protein